MRHVKVSTQIMDSAGHRSEKASAKIAYHWIRNATPPLRELDTNVGQDTKYENRAPLKDILPTEYTHTHYRTL